jgi:rubrerythrin
MKEFTSVNDILNFAIEGEQEAVDFYTKLAGQVENESMKNNFIQFAHEEMEHKAKLLDVQQKGFFEMSFEKIADLKIADYIVKAHAGPNMTYQDALILAMNKEKAAFRLYTNLSEKAPNTELKNLFQMLAQEESKHKLRFEIEYDEFVLREN